MYISSYQAISRLLQTHYSHHTNITSYYKHITSHHFHMILHTYHTISCPHQAPHTHIIVHHTHISLEYYIKIHITPYHVYITSYHIYITPHVMPNILLYCKLLYCDLANAVLCMFSFLSICCGFESCTGNALLFILLVYILRVLWGSSD